MASWAKICDERGQSQCCVETTLYLNKQIIRLETTDVTVLYQMLTSKRGCPSCTRHLHIETLRILRNFSAGSTHNQNDILRAPVPLLLECFSRIELILGGVPSEDTELAVIELRCSIQFLGNLVTNNEDAKKEVWKGMFPFLRSLLVHGDANVRKYSTMLVYNCLLDMPCHQETMLNGDFVDKELVTCLFDAMIRDECEWGLYALESLMEFSSLENWYPLLSLEHRLALLDITSTQLSDKRLSIKHITFFAGHFEKKADKILTFKEPITTLQTDPVEVLKLLSLLCGASSEESLHLLQIQQCPSLLCTVICLLRGVHLADGGLSVAAKFEDGDQSESPTFGLKRSLIQLVANLCWRNKANQDKVREFDGIPLLLDCCKLDVRNPYITQWVIFAIRNLCEGNEENQLLIGQMERQGVQESSILRDMGIRVQETKDGKLTFTVDGRTRTEHTQDDIKDLFS